MARIYYAIAWYFDVSYQEAIDIYEEMSRLGEYSQLEAIDRAYTDWRHMADE